MVLRKLLQKYLTIVFEFITVKEGFCLSESLYNLRKYCLFLLKPFCILSSSIMFHKRRFDRSRDKSRHFRNRLQFKGTRLIRLENSLKKKFVLCENVLGRGNLTEETASTSSIKNSQTSNI
jgi:hypothetical protein